MFLGPGTIQHGDGPGRVARQSVAAEGGDLGQRPVTRNAQDRRRRDLHDPATCRAFRRARLRRFFLLGRGPREGSFRVVPEIRDLVKFRHLDLRNPAWPVPADFPIIFCRNVSIYFAEDERLTLLNRLAQHLRPGGWLAMGNGEILPEVPPSLRKHSPSLFQKEG